MPLLSERQALLKQLDTVLKYLMLDGKEESEDFKEVYELKGSISRTRYFNLRVHLEKNRTMHDMLWRVSDRDFKQWVRCEKSSVLRLVKLIAPHPIFYGKEGGVPGNFHHRHKQAPIWVQLMVVLSKYDVMVMLLHKEQMEGITVFLQAKLSSSQKDFSRRF